MTIHKSKYSMIFKTFNSDIDNISSKWGLFGKSFYDVSTDIEKRWNNVSKTLQSTNDYTLQNITNAWKMGNSNPIKFLADDEVVSILDRYNKALDSGAEATAKFLNSGTGNEFMDGFLKDLDGAPATMDKYKVATKNATMAQKSFSASTIATKAAVLALNVAVSMGLSIALSALIKTISEVAQSEENLKDASRELGSELSNNASTIEDYKEKINDLKSVLSDSSSSFDDVSQAREDLMVIQDELIKKFGTEKGVIEDITEAIYGQTDALDQLSKDTYYKAVDEFNQKTSGDKFVDWLTFGNKDDNRVQSNMDKMIRQMESSVYSLETTGNEVLDNLIAKSLGLTISSDTYGNGKHFTIYGELDEIQEKLTTIREMASDFDVSTGFENSFTDISNDVNSLLQAHKNLYNQYILWEKILTDNPDNQYDEQYNLINQAKEAYDKAVKSGDTNAIQKASEEYSKTLSSAIDLAMSNYDYDVASYFEDMYPDMQQMFSEWKFTLDFEPNTEGLKDRVSNSLTNLDGFSSEDILAFNPNVATDEQITAYGELNNVATEYGLTLQGLINLLLQMGLIQSESYQQLVDQFGQDNVNKIDQEDLTFAYQVKNVGDMTFEELQAEIQRLKDEAQNPDETAVLSFEEQITQIHNLSEGLDQLDEIMADVIEGESFDYSSILGNDDFKNAFGKYTKEYENFIHTITNSPDDISKCKSAFNDLATAYIYGSGALANLTEESKQASILELSQLGIANATEIVNDIFDKYSQALDVAKKYSIDLENQTMLTVSELANEKDMAIEDAEALYNYAMQKELCSENPIDTVDDCEALLNLARQANATAETISLLNRLKNSMAVINSEGAATWGPQTKDLAQKEIDSIMAELQSAKFTTNFSTDVKFGGGSKVKKEKKDSSKSDKDTTKTLDLIEVRVDKLNDALSLLEANLENVQGAFAKNKLIDAQIGLNAEKVNNYTDALAVYTQKANEALSGIPTDVAEQLKNGAVGIVDYIDDSNGSISEAIENYQKWNDKVVECQEELAELREELEKLEKIKFQNIVKDFEDMRGFHEGTNSILDAWKTYFEASGEFVGQGLFEAQKNQSENMLKLYEQEKEALVKQLNSALDSGRVNLCPAV